MSSFKIFHNPRCSKSRQALQILQENNCDYEIFLYLDMELNTHLIEDILKKLDLSPRELLRKGELDYKDNDLRNIEHSDQDIMNFMIKFPKLIERPIVVKGNRAVIGRPPERVKELL
ncbi:arsenate reductase (glutaredoxin) [Gammaproteobacteria bacterium]|nr:arsenate reductase (glutaredoxin) [Gammaproteobacteria bacterium]MDB4244625.1 arsenate reductase (glutaredoxin) [Gammaproteobacteria bacterium]